MSTPPSKPPKPPRPAATEAAPRAEPAAGATGAVGPFRKLLRAVFVDQLTLRREGQQLKLALAAAEPAPKAEPAALARDPALREMHQALARLLDGQPDSRGVLRHLATLEHHLQHAPGPSFIQDLSLPSLQTMLRQLHGLITPPASAGAQALLSLLLEAAEQKSRLEPRGTNSQAISSFFVDHKLEVHEMPDPPTETLEAFLGEAPEPPARG